MWEFGCCRCSRIDVSGQALYPKGDSVLAGSRLMVSVDTGDWDRLPVTIVTRSLTPSTLKDMELN